MTISRKKKPNWVNAKKSRTAKVNKILTFTKKMSRKQIPSGSTMKKKPNSFLRKPVKKWIWRSTRIWRAKWRKPKANCWGLSGWMIKLKRKRSQSFDDQIFCLILIWMHSFQYFLSFFKISNHQKSSTLFLVISLFVIVIIKFTFTFICKCPSKQLPASIK